MSRIFRAALWILLLVSACSTPSATILLTPSSPPTTITQPLPSPTPAPIATTARALPTLDTEAFLLKPNQDYAVSVKFFRNAPATVNIVVPESERPVSFEIEAQNPAADNPTFPQQMQSPGTMWGLPYIIHALNVQTGDWGYLYDTVRGSMVLSPDTRTLAYYLCNESGGRGQWCYGRRLWLFNMRTGETVLADLSESGLLSACNLQFSDDGQTLSAEGCISYPNPYFGWCATTVSTRWDVKTGRQLDTEIIATQDVHYP